jgi:hypothetical protein
MIFYSMRPDSPEGLALCDAIGQCLAERDARIDALQRRVDAMEDKQIKFCGVYQHGARYEAGSFVTRNGGLWYAQTNTCGTPGQSSDWTLAVKRGAAG